jgi:hypothetical protein
LFVNSANRVLAVNTAGKVVRDTGVIPGLNPGEPWWPIPVQESAGRNLDYRRG